MLKSYRELKVWKKSYNLCVKIYRITKGFPLEERYVLTSQIRRSALSIPSNIAEGYGRKTKPDYIRILYIAYGSVCELDTQILLAGDLKYLQTTVGDDLNQDISEVEIMLKALIRSLEKRHIA
jgi:four helix bundle protein